MPDDLHDLNADVAQAIEEDSVAGRRARRRRRAEERHVAGLSRRQTWWLETDGLRQGAVPDRREKRAER